MNPSDLIFVGIHGCVIALERETGRQVWATHLKGAGFVNVVLDRDRILATCRGEIFCLDPATGQGLWENPLKGLGLGLATIATENAPAGAPPLPLVEQINRERRQAAAAGGAGA